MKRSLKFTRAGWITVFISLGVGLSALNTGNNLLYIVFGGVLGLILASGIVSERNLQRLQVDWIVPGEIHAGRASIVRLLLRNLKSRPPAAALEVALRFSGPPGKDGKHHFSWAGWFLSVPPQGQRHFDAPFIPTRRGLYALENCSITTEFPFGLFKKTAVLRQEGSVLVYPAVDAGSVRDASVPGTDPRRALERGEGDSFWGMREFQSGDSMRRISWKTTARLGRFVVSETERETEQKVILSLDPQTAWQKLPPDALEEAVSFAASLACSLLTKNVAVGLAFGGHLIPPSAAPGQKPHLLKTFALYEPHLKYPQSGDLPENVSHLDVLSAWKGQK